MQIVPVTERIIDRYNRFQTVFKFGPFTVQIFLKDGRYIPGNIRDRIEQVENRYGVKTFKKRFACFIFIDNHIWSWYESDYENEAIDEYMRVIKLLKNGEEVTFQDVVEKKEPLTLSWCMLKWGH